MRRERRRARSTGSVRLSLLLCLAAGLATAPPAGAEQDGRAGLRLLLSAYHEPPAPAALARAAERPAEALHALAADRAEPTLLRRRAATALGLLGGPEADRALADLLRRSDEGAVRRAAAAALARALADRPDELVALLGELLRSPEPDDREAAVRLLARLGTPPALDLLRRRRQVERHRQVVEALARAAR